MKDFFLQQYRMLRRSPQNPVPDVAADPEYPETQVPADPMAERYVEWQISRFLRDLEEKSDAIEVGLKDAREAREKVVQTANPQKADHQEWKQALARVADQADSLADMLSQVLIDLEVNKKLETFERPKPAELFQRETSLLESEVGKLKTGLTNLFLSPTNTVRVDELKGENVLTSLYRIENVSRKMIKGL